jgi:DNA-binding PadR family transcriptional regulator
MLNRDKRISKDLIGASTIPIILSILLKGDSYGYQIMQQVKEMSHGRIEWKEGSLYPVLKKLENEKKIKSYWQVNSTERPRKYYTILDAGKNELLKEKKQCVVPSTFGGCQWHSRYQLQKSNANGTHDRKCSSLIKTQQ